MRITGNVRVLELSEDGTLGFHPDDIDSILEDNEIITKVPFAKNTLTWDVKIGPPGSEGRCPVTKQ
jgi:hypothetical protein